MEVRIEVAKSLDFTLTSGQELDILPPLAVQLYFIMLAYQSIHDMSQLGRESRTQITNMKMRAGPQLRRRPNRASSAAFLYLQNCT